MFLNLRVIPLDLEPEIVQICQQGNGGIGAKGASSQSKARPGAKPGGPGGNQEQARMNRFGANAGKIQKLQAVARKGSGATAGERSAAVNRISNFAKKGASKSAAGASKSAAKPINLSPRVLAPAKANKGGRPKKGSKSKSFRDRAARSA